MYLTQTNVELHCKPVIILLNFLIFYSTVCHLMIVGEEKKVDTSQKINIIEDINYDWVFTLLISHTPAYMAPDLVPKKRIK